MVDLPLNKRAHREPLVPAIEKQVNAPRMEDIAMTSSMFTNISSDEIRLQLSNGHNEVVRETRRIVEEATPSETTVVEQSFREQKSPDDAVEDMRRLRQKKLDYSSSSDNIYLEQALGLSNPDIDAEVINFAVNVQLANELFATRIAASQEETGVAGYIGGFVDRYVLRAFPIGGFEQVTNRNERKGNEMIAAAQSMSQDEYIVFVNNYLDELASEGIFMGDNIFAYLDGMYELASAGEDPSEGLNRTFGAVDLLPMAALLSKTKTVLRSGSFLTRVGAIKGTNAAGDAGEALIKNNPTNIAPDVALDMGPSGMSPVRTGPVRPPMGRSAKIAEENRIVRGLAKLNDNDFLGEGITSASVKNAVGRILTSLETSSNRPIADIRQSVAKTPTGNYEFQADIGTLRSGTPYRTERAAKTAAAKLTNDFPTATVRQVDSEDKSKGFFVSVSEIVNVGTEAAELSTKSTLNPINKIYASLLGSKATIENQLLNQLAILAEGGTSAIGKIVKPSVKKLDSLSVDSKDVLSKIYGELRDGADAYIRDSYTDGDISSKFMQYTGRKPTQKEIDAFHALRDINDATWMMRAHERIKKYVARGYYGIKGPEGERIPAKKVENLASDELVLNLKDRRLLSASGYRKNTAIWKLDRELEGGIQYVANPEDVKVLSPEDVLGYNAGGRRINPDAKYFVTVGKQNPKGFLSTFTAEQAEEVRNIFKAVKAQIDEAGGIDSMGNTKGLDDLIESSNSWNPEIQSFSDLVKFAKARKISLTDDINVKARDGKVQTGETLDELSETWDEYMTFHLHRSDTVLTEYGGKEARQRDPVTAIFDDFSSVTHHYAHNVVTQEGVNGWVKAAKRKGSGWEVPDHPDPRKAFEEAKKTEATGSANELDTQRSILRNRMSIKSDAYRRMEDFGSSVQEFVFNKTGFKTSSDLGIAKAQNSLLSLGFQSAFGFFNVAQFFVQGFHAPVVAAMAPRYGVKALGMAIPLRALLMVDNVTTETLGVQRLAKFYGYKEQDIVELVEFIHTTGRNIVNESALENGTGVQWGLSGWKGESFLPSAIRGTKQRVTQGAGKAADAATVFFQEGDRAARLTAINTAFLEFKAANPGMSALSELGMRTIRAREEALTLRMTNANRAFVQEGAAKLPTQWFSHSLRVMENVFIGRDLTKGERARMLAMYLPFFGLTGMGMGKATDYVAEKLGAEPASVAHTTIRYGLLDGLFDWGGDIELALAERMAPITLFQDVYKDLEGNKSVFEVAGGPSANIASGFVNQLFAATSDAMNGNSMAMTNDLVRTLRNISGLDNIAKARGIMENGMYRSRTGTTLPFELNSSDAIGQLLGFTPAEVSQWYADKEWKYNTDTNVKDFTKRVQTDWSQAVELWNTGDEEGGAQAMREIAALIQFSNLAESDKATVRRSLRDKGAEDITRMILDFYKRDKPYSAERVERDYKIGDQE